MSTEELKIIKEFNRNVAWLKTQTLKDKKQVWAKVSKVKELTGWDHEGMRKARDNGYISWEKREGEIWYDLNSIDEKFIIKQA